MADPSKKAALVPAEARRQAQTDSRKMGAAQERSARFGGPMRESPGFVKIGAGKVVEETRTKLFVNHPDASSVPQTDGGSEGRFRAERRGHEARPVADGAQRFADSYRAAAARLR
ncbi:MAG: hypothetical protein J7485_06895, partial [Sphingobium sp.]|nr:hypothetical protein [Sphingobium sp.]